jgi:hypothetical protein
VVQVGGSTRILEKMQNWELKKFAIFGKCHKDKQSKDSHVWEDSSIAHNTVTEKHEEKGVSGTCKRGRESNINVHFKHGRGSTLRKIVNALYFISTEHTIPKVHTQCYVLSRPCTCKSQTRWGGGVTWVRANIIEKKHSGQTYE